MKIKYVVGDVLDTQEKGLKYLVHVCNDIGAFGAGVSGAIGKKYPIVESAYRAWHKGGVSFHLGQVQFIKVQHDLVIVNMIAQHLIGCDENGGPCIRYEALDECLQRVAKEIGRTGGRIVTIRLGCGLAQGKWAEVEKFLNKNFTEQNIAVTIFSLSGEVW